LSAFACIVVLLPCDRPLLYHRLHETPLKIAIRRRPRGLRAEAAARPVRASLGTGHGLRDVERRAGRLPTLRPRRRDTRRLRSVPISGSGDGPHRIAMAANKVPGVLRGRVLLGGAGQERARAQRRRRAPRSRRSRQPEPPSASSRVFLTTSASRTPRRRVQMIRDLDGAAASRPTISPHRRAVNQLAEDAAARGRGCPALAPPTLAKLIDHTLLQARGDPARHQKRATRHASTLSLW